MDVLTSSGVFKFLPIIFSIGIGLIIFATSGNINPTYVGIAFFLGILMGLTSTGGGAIMTPILVIFGIRPIVAIGTGLAFASITFAVGSIRHRQQGTVHFRLFRYLTLGSIPGSLAGVAMTSFFEAAYGIAADAILARILGITLVFASLLAVLPRKRRDENGLRVVDGEFSLRKKMSVMFLGSAVGFLVGLTSVGAGTIILIGLLLLFQLPVGMIVGTTMLNAAVLQGVAGLGHFGLGNVQLDLLASLLMGSLPGAVIGSRMVKLIPERWLRLILVFTVLISGLAMLSKYGL